MTKLLPRYWINFPAVKFLQLGLLVILIKIPAFSFAGEHKKIIYINSYHQGYAWSDGIQKGIEDRLSLEDIKLETFYMDSKRKRLPEQIKLAADNAMSLIQQTKPDLIILSDDNAAKYILAHYNGSAQIPIVYCGINWDASEYGLPFENTTGMIEVAHISALVDLLSNYTVGDRLGFLSIDALSGHRTLDFYQKKLERDFDQVYFVNSVEEWQSKYIALQSEVDMMILENPKGVTGWNFVTAQAFVQRESLIPSGSTHLWLAPLTLLSIGKVPGEQGWWAADAGMKILNGAAPSTIPEAENKEAELIANFKLAEKIGVTFSHEILETSTLLTQ